MAEYTARTWSNGDIITASNLNNIEDGIAEALECCGSDGSSSGGGTDSNILWLEVESLYAEPNEWIGYRITTTFADIEQALIDGKEIRFRNETYSETDSLTSRVCQFAGYSREGADSNLSYMWMQELYHGSSIMYLFYCLSDYGNYPVYLSD